MLSQHRCPTALATGLAALLLSSAAHAQSRPAVVVTVENGAPAQGTFQTPVWVGLHDGSFDIYDSGALASTLPIAGSGAVESIAEDGSPALLSADFTTAAPTGVQGVLLSNDPMLPPLAPGRSVSRLFEVDPLVNRYFSYTSMVIPSNDAFIANGSPTAHPLFDGAGNFIAQGFRVLGGEVLDAGTEMNDELPANTAFFGQMAPNTGVTTSNTIAPHVGFLPVGAGGILADPMFAAADFLAPGYENARFSFRLIDRAGRFRFTGRPDGAQEVGGTGMISQGRGVTRVSVRGDKDRVRLIVVCGNLSGAATAAHLHLAPRGQNGPVVVDLTSSITTVGGTGAVIATTFDAAAIVGPLAGQADPMGALIAELLTGGVYVNVHSAAFPAGEVRGQLN